LGSPERPATRRLILVLAALLPLAVTAAQLAVAAAAALTLTTAQERVRGWSRGDLLSVRESAVHGRGVVATAPIAEGTVVGRYPGVVRGCDSVAAKAQAAPACKGYLFNTDDGRCLDPTDARGKVSTMPGVKGWRGVELRLRCVQLEKLTSMRVTQGPA